jgi:uncharacterized protein YrrD
MTYDSVRHFLGLPVILSPQKGKEQIIGVVETVVINPKLLVVDGFLVGSAGSKEQTFLPLGCILENADGHLKVSQCIESPQKAQRILGLPAYKKDGRTPLGFVYDMSFQAADGFIDMFIVHQLLRQWPIARTSVEKVTPKALLIDTDTSIRLKTDLLSGV